MLCFVVLLLLLCFCLVLSQWSHSTLTLDRVAPSPFPRDPNLYQECLDFLSLKQNLPRVLTVDQSGPGLVKVNSTCIQIQFRPVAIPKVDFLILFPHSMLLRRPTPRQTMAEEEANGTQNSLQLMRSQLRCLASHLRIQ
jgi:hypothetical protein